MGNFCNKKGTVSGGRQLLLCLVYYRVFRKARVFGGIFGFLSDLEGFFKEF